jgi:hypothetical protein
LDCLGSWTKPEQTGATFGFPRFFLGLNYFINNSLLVKGKITA